MHCPNCGHKQICGCRSCTKRRNPIKRFLQWLGIIKPYYWPDRAELIACGNCHLTALAAWWEELGIDVTLKREGVSSLTELAERNQEAMRAKAEL